MDGIFYVGLSLYRSCYAMVKVDHRLTRAGGGGTEIKIKQNKYFDYI